MALVGAAFGGMLTVTLVAMISAVEVRDQADVTSMMYPFRSTGAVIGVATASAVVRNVLRLKLWIQFDHGENGAGISCKIINSLNEMDRLTWQDRELVRDSYMISLTVVFVATVGLVVLGLVSGLLLIKELRLQTIISSWKNADTNECRRAS